MKRFVNPDVDTLNEAYRAARASKKVLIDKKALLGEICG